MFDETEVDPEGRLVVRCEDAPEEAVDLTRPECLRAILRHLQEEAGVRGIVLVHDREKAYGSRAMAALNALLALARLLDQFGQRAPAPNFPGFTAKEVEGVCATCEFRPATLFSRLRDALLADPAAFLGVTREVAAALDRYEEEGCGSCAGATVQDLRILIADLERFPGG